MVCESQLEMFADEGDAEDVIFVENLTLDADRVLMQNIGKHREVLIIGVSEHGGEFFSNTGNIPKWLYWLRRCEEFMMRNEM